MSSSCTMNGVVNLLDKTSIGSTTPSPLLDPATSSSSIETSIDDNNINALPFKNNEKNTSNIATDNTCDASAVSNNNNKKNTINWIGAKLEEQPWQSIGLCSDERIGATDNFDCMVNQLTSVLSERLLSLILSRSDHRIHEYTTYDHDNSGNHNSIKNNNSNINDFSNNTYQSYHHHNYKLSSNIQNSLHAYVTRIGKLYRNVYYHNFEHAVHVTISANKLISMIMDHRNSSSFQTLGLSDIMSEQRNNLYNNNNNNYNDPAESGEGSTALAETCDDYQQHEQSNINLHGSQNTIISNNIHNNHNEDTKHPNHDITFGISSSATVQFAFVFSALIHDVDHQGVPNATLVDEEDPLSIMHNDISVAEQHSLQVAFSILAEDEFKQLKQCIMPCKSSRKEFRKMVIDIVLVTDISNPERMQISQSKWEEAFPKQLLNTDSSVTDDEDDDISDHDDDDYSDDGFGIGDSYHSKTDSVLEEDHQDILDELISDEEPETISEQQEHHEGDQQDQDTIVDNSRDRLHHSTTDILESRRMTRKDSVDSHKTSPTSGRYNRATSTASSSRHSASNHADDTNNLSNNNHCFDSNPVIRKSSMNMTQPVRRGDSLPMHNTKNTSRRLNQSTSAIPTYGRNSSGIGVGSNTKKNKRQTKMKRSSRSSVLGMIKGGTMASSVAVRQPKRHSMYTSYKSYCKMRREQLGLRQSLDLGGKVISIYESTNEGEMKLRQDTVINTLINVADVAHTMQSFDTFVKWNKRLFKELLYAYHNDRIEWDPTVGWYANQINFFDKYIIPLAKKMDECGVFGQGKSSIFLLLALENKRKWQVDGITITNNLVEEVGKELITNGHNYSDYSSHSRLSNND